MDDFSRGHYARRDDALLTATQTELASNEFVAQHADAFAVFDSATQDSGNVSYGVRVDGQRNAVRIARCVSDPALPALRNVVESAEGPLLVYDWVEGDLIGTSAARRADPTSAFARFLALDAHERAAALDAVFRVHVTLAQRGWIASDFYDGSLIYDFARRRMHVVDLDSYRDAPFTNDMGRMFGSSRFMAPEEYVLGARIDERTTVFTMGRTVEQFLPLGIAPVADLVARACQPDPARRLASVADFYQMWSATRF